jgi:NAD(P)-dependent dehydrogenase (short-subunit alcohol dehydrogenase family)
LDLIPHAPEPAVDDIWADATAFITGGAQGIGLALAEALASRGVRVAIADLDEQALDAAHERLAASAEVAAYHLDVRDRARYAQVADAAEAALGPVTLLFNNAGVAGGCSVKQMTYEHWDWMLGVNLDGVVNGIQTFVPRMLGRERGGYIVNTASGAGLVAAGAGFLYTTSKFAVVGMSEALALELAPHGIGVSVLCPGPVATNIVENTWKSGPAAAETQDPRVRASLAETTAFLQAQGVTPQRVAEMVIAAMNARRLHVLTDQILRAPLMQRAALLMEAFPTESQPAAGDVAQAGDAMTG